MTHPTTRPFFSISAVLALSALVAAIFATSARAITLDTVPVGNPGNAADPSTGNLYGSVSHNYRIGTTEVTVGQYTAFLNAVAATDTYALYNPLMASDANIAGILQSGASGSYTYSVIGSPNRPVTYVSWGDAARFSNWLHNGQTTGAQGPGTTETGAYTLNGATTAGALNLVSRNAGATWFIPSESEWYKAAYFQPAAEGGDVDSYWAYPMGTNSAPYSDQPPGAAPDNTRVGNFYANDDSANGYDDGYAVTGSLSYSLSENYLTDGGAYSSSASFYGTYDQGGNVWEWNETLIGGSLRGLRGGGWDASSTHQQASFRDNFDPTGELFSFGFRVATVPEPSTYVLGATALFGLMAFRRRKLARA